MLRKLVLQKQNLHNFDYKTSIILIQTLKLLR